LYLKVSIKIATLNINGMTPPTRRAMFEALLRRQGTDILLVQDVTFHVLDDVQGYTTQYNIGANRRGTVIVARDGINL